MVPWRLYNVRPVLAGFDPMDARVTDAVLIGKRTFSFTGCQPLPYGTNLILCQPGRTVLLTARGIVAAFRNLVLTIITVRAKKQMSRIHTSRRIAAMANQKISRWSDAIVQLIRDTVSKARFPVIPHIAIIGMAESLALPQPAIIRTGTDEHTLHKAHDVRAFRLGTATGERAEPATTSRDLGGFRVKGFRTEQTSSCYCGHCQSVLSIGRATDVTSIAWLSDALNYTIGGEHGR